LVGMGSGIREPRREQTLPVRLDPRLPARMPEFIQNPIVGDLKYPWTKGAPLGGEGAGFAPDREEDVLDDLLRGGAIQCVGGQGEDPRRVAAVERPERLLPSGGQALHQLLVARLPGIPAGALSGLGAGPLPARLSPAPSRALARHRQFPATVVMRMTAHLLIHHGGRFGLDLDNTPRPQSMLGVSVY